MTKVSFYGASGDEAKSSGRCRTEVADRAKILPSTVEATSDERGKE